jgi:hypothetical protein
LKNIKIEHLFIIFVAIVVSIISVIIGIRQYHTKKYVMENFNVVEAKITFVFNTGRRTKAKTELDIEYIYNNQTIETEITRQWKGNDYYKKGDTIIIYINPNDENDIR